MSGFPNNTNPYTPPEPVEEDAPSFDLRKIAGLYSRLRVWRKRLIGFFVLDFIFSLSLVLLTPTTVHISFVDVVCIMHI